MSTILDSPALTTDAVSTTASQVSMRAFLKEDSLVQANSTASELDQNLAGTVSDKSIAPTEQSDVENAEAETAGASAVTELTAVREEDVLPSTSPAPKDGVFRRLTRKMSLQKVSSPKERRSSISSNPAIEDSGDKDRVIVEDVTEDAAAASPEPEAAIAANIAEAAEEVGASGAVDALPTPSKPKSGPFQQLKEKLKARRRDSAGFSPASSMSSLPASASVIPDPSTTGAEPTSTPVQQESATLAHQIRKLVADLPCPESDTPFPKPPTPSTMQPIQYDKITGRPITPPSAIFTNDTVLIKKLRDPAIMNGKEDDEPSVFTILQQLGPDDAGPVDPSEGEKSQDGGDVHPDRPTILHDSSIMMYSPLEPTEGDEVELAHFKFVPLSEFPDNKFVPRPGTAAWKLQWPFHKKGKPSNAPATSPGTSPDKVVKVWLPSTTKMSIQCLWWGYRLYLPPPVLAVLSDESIEAAKRAALITTALTWFFNSLPVSVVPAPMIPALLLLQKIVPFVGYIGSFISWSFAQVKSYDVGYGVTLSATWVLPMALIPGTWQKYDFPQVTSPSQGTGSGVGAGTGNGTGTGTPSSTPGPIPSTGMGTGSPVATQPSPAPTNPSSPGMGKTPDSPPRLSTPSNPLPSPSGDITIQPVATGTTDPSDIPTGKDGADLASAPSAKDVAKFSGNADANAGAEADDPVTKEEGQPEQKEAGTETETQVAKNSEEMKEDKDQKSEHKTAASEADDKVGDLNGVDTGAQAGDAVEKTEKTEKRKSRGIVGGLFNYFLGSR
ncbi:hypothetical protein D9758_002929 [Tetrapyrgos nigripes]|uniref:Uncharacterized protein n=1 Tax=Tetrapyrgos nigripes TaxID=182062 RepID=A0A8H5GQ71_9AGAR|nr:hypothetical protein D9758_002929 [Tetrapyrgos nigripes]